MFEYCGIRDIFVGLWKYKKYILCIILISVFILCGKNYVKAQNVVEQVSYTATGQYFFESVMDESKGGNSIVKYSGGQIAIIYKSLIESGVTREYIVDFLEKRGEIVSISEISNYISCATTGDGFVLNIAVTAPTQNMVEYIFDAFNEYFNTYQKELYDKGDDSYTILGISETQELSNNVEFDLAKNIFSGVIVGGFIGVFVIGVYCLLNPTINRKYDFEMLGIPVIGNFQIKENK